VAPVSGIAIAGTDGETTSQPWLTY
jgi:hypothetical protein